MTPCIAICKKFIFCEISQVISSQVTILNKELWKKLTKVSEIDFSMECFTADFLRDFTINIKIWLLGGRLSTSYQIS